MIHDQYCTWHALLPYKEKTNVPFLFFLWLLTGHLGESTASGQGTTGTWQVGCAQQPGSQSTVHEHACVSMGSCRHRWLKFYSESCAPEIQPLPCTYLAPVHRKCCSALMHGRQRCCLSCTCPARMLVSTESAALVHRTCTCLSLTRMPQLPKCGRAQGKPCCAVRVLHRSQHW